MIDTTQKQLFEYIVQYKRDHDGNSPTFRQIRDALGLSSTSVTSYLLTELERAGKIKRPEFNRSRQLEVVGGTWDYWPTQH